MPVEFTSKIIKKHNEIMKNKPRFKLTYFLLVAHKKNIILLIN